jgi:hypothetical protein
VGSILGQVGVADKRHESGDDVPVVIFDRNDTAWAFRRSSEAADWMEPVDVSDGEYHGYDADGYILDLSVTNGRTTISKTARKASREAVEELRRSEGPLGITAAGTLADMIQQALALQEESTLKTRCSRQWLGSFADVDADSRRRNVVQK